MVILLRLLVVRVAVLLLLLLSVRWCPIIITTIINNAVGRTVITVAVTSFDHHYDDNSINSYDLLEEDDGNDNNNGDTLISRPSTGTERSNDIDNKNDNLVDMIKDDVDAEDTGLEDQPATSSTTTAQPPIIALAVDVSFVISNFEHYTAVNITLDHNNDHLHPHHLHQAFDKFLQDLIIMSMRMVTTNRTKTTLSRSNQADGGTVTLSDDCHHHTMNVVDDDKDVYFGDSEDEDEEETQFRHNLRFHHFFLCEQTSGHRHSLLPILFDKLISNLSILTFELYGFQDTPCPMVMEGPGDPPLCQTIFAHYNLGWHHRHLDHHQMEGKSAAEMTTMMEYDMMNLTRFAIQEGMLEESLQSVQPDSPFTVEQAGPIVLQNQNSEAAAAYDNYPTTTTAITTTNDDPLTAEKPRESRNNQGQSWTMTEQATMGEDELDHWENEKPSLLRAKIVPRIGEGGEGKITDKLLGD